MAIHVTTGVTTTLPQMNNMRITVNAALTGTITVNDQSGVNGAAAVIAVITNPAVGNSFVYNGLAGIPTVVTSTTCDITISSVNY